MFPLQARERGGRGAEDADFFAIVRRKILGKLARPEDRFFEAGIAHNHVGERSEGRIGHHTAEVEFALEEREVILLDGVLNGVVVGIKSLDEHATGEVAAASAAGDLGEQLKGALGRAEVRQTERGIGADHADQSDTLKIVALGEHLCADENVERAAGESAKRFLILALGAGGVAVEAGDARTGKFFAQALLEMLGALTEEIDIFGLALGAELRDWLN